jgi:YidC/Oxa1 family membrane protein insertase
MERRLTAFVIPVLLAVLGFSIFGNGSAGGDAPVVREDDPAAVRALVEVQDVQGQGTSAPSPIPETVFTRSFGEVGEIGFRVEFDRRGAAVRRIWLLDHEQLGTDGEVVDGETDGEPGERYLIAKTVQQGVLNLVLEKSRTDKFGGTAIDGWDPEAGQTVAWAAEDLPEGRGVRFTLPTASGLVLERTYSWEPGRRDLLVEIAVRGGEEPRTDIGAPIDLRLRGVALPNPKRNYVLGANPAVVAYGVRLEGDTKDEFVRPNDIEDPGIVTLATASGARAQLRFAGTTNRFFTGLLYPADEAGASAWTGVGAEARPTVDLRIGDEVDVPARSIPMAQYDLRLDVPGTGEVSRAAFRLYLGPKSKRVFARSDFANEYEQFGPVVDHDLQPIGCFCPIPGAQEIARFLLWLLGLFHDLVGNWGIAIMILTICVRGALLPLNFRMQKSMRAYGARAAKAAPEMERIKQKYKDDPKQMQMALLQFQRENKLFPPVGGCLPMFVTIPIFIGLFSALRASYDLRGQEFFAWVNDLSQPDRLAVLPLGPLGDIPLNLLPLLWCGLTFYLQSQAPLPKDPQQRQMMQIMRLMPLMFGVLLYNYASGLMVYMLTSGTFALIEMRAVRKILGPMPETPMGGTPMPL